MSQANERSRDQPASPEPDPRWPAATRSPFSNEDPPEPNPGRLDRLAESRRYEFFGYF